MMRVSVFGLGYVGCVSAASLAAEGHQVVGVDVNPDKVATVNAGRSPIVEPGLEEVLAGAVAAGRLRATTSTADAVSDSDVSLVCVGTPSHRNGSLDLTYLERVCGQIGEALRQKSTYHVVVVRSTVLPGTTHGVVIPALERIATYGKVWVSVNPGFPRTASRTSKPPLTLVITTMRRMRPARWLSITHRRTAREHGHPRCGMMKHRQHLARAEGCFANGTATSAGGGRRQPRVMDIFCKDDKLNLSSYFKTGLRVRRIVPARTCGPPSRQGGRSRPTGHFDLAAIVQIEHAFDQVMTPKEANQTAGFQLQGQPTTCARAAGDPLGSVQGAEAEDLRQERVAARLSARTRTTSRNRFRTFLAVCSVDEVIEGSEVIVIGNQAPEFLDAVASATRDQIVIDLVRLPMLGRTLEADYRGICW